MSILLRGLHGLGEEIGDRSRRSRLGYDCQSVGRNAARNGGMAGLEARSTGLVG
jgi:hypothetical protein